MGVSKNNGTPKSSILIGFSIINHPFWGTLIFGNTYIPFVSYIPPLAVIPWVSRSHLQRAVQRSAEKNPHRKITQGMTRRKLEDIGICDMWCFFLMFLFFLGYLLFFNDFESAHANLVSNQRLFLFVCQFFFCLLLLSLFPSDDTNISYPPWNWQQKRLKARFETQQTRIHLPILCCFRGYVFRCFFQGSVN